MMRRIFLFMHISLDGYFEGPGHDISWFNDDDHHFEAFSREQSKEVDTLLFGHKTYEMMKSFWPTAQAHEIAPDVAQVMNQRQKVVASHQPFEPGWNNVTVISQDILAAVKTLKAQPGKTIGIFGSNNLCVSLMQAGLIDEFRIVVNPVVLSGGTPLFYGLPQPAALKLIDTLPFKSGKVMLTYQPSGQ